MKKIIILFLVFFVMVSCHQNKNDPTTLQTNRQETLDKEVINAISKNNFALTQKLISEGADIHSIANKEYDLFSEIIVPPNRIITSAQFKEMYELMQEEFLQAIEEEHYDDIENLINKGIDINMTGYELTPLDFSQEYAGPMMKYLVEKGLDNIIDNGGDISSQVELVNKIVSVIKRHPPRQVSRARPGSKQNGRYPMFPSH